MLSPTLNGACYFRTQTDFGIRWFSMTASRISCWCLSCFAFEDQPNAGGDCGPLVFWYAFLRVFIDLFRDYPTHRLALGTGQTLNIIMASIGVVLLIRSRLRRLGRLRSGAEAAVAGKPLPENAPLALQKVVFVVLLVFCMTLPSNWTQNVPERYGGRHAGLEHSWLYPDIDTAATIEDP